MKNKEYVNNLLDSLSRSKFRGSFHLNSKMKNYAKENGYRKLESDAFELIRNRLGPATILNDGKQTPMRQVHPVFIAQHACGCCCRGCLEKIHHIPKKRELSENEINYIVYILMTWIAREVNK